MTKKVDEPSIDQKFALITGYGPFKSFKVNPSYESVRNLQARVFPGLGLDNNEGHQQNEVLVHVMEIPVEYHRVHAIAPTFFNAASSPRFVLHVGASGQLKPAHMVFETRARNGPYMSKDVVGDLPEGNQCFPPEGLGNVGEHTVEEELRVCPKLLAQVVERVQQELDSLGDTPNTPSKSSSEVPTESEEIAKKNDTGDVPDVEQTFEVSKGLWKVGTSTNAGLYLCEYIFYHGMHWAKRRWEVAPPVFFLHVPSVDVEKGHRPQEELNRAIELVVKALCAVC
ncbi:uncharacterized protein SPPG_01041 [Spizellomyces punctatus DAOM BR117]|uniref:Pyroglutamyl-peptidase I n=1 Tax=Spizellomyces punctatus (strain DAOM BR117) TaxID=645134 RepID=A0A0L0HQB3_SPIPD|nr:uncharacterized protein SPPG_01041 [Spizellomyces punctatus DAOM BR117]KND03566.1 hypothetical protein SPPG_01041 [Spizellomyces punctatus DAOM BR117]|eukprot:XP_016611605.1 hypothetical protein SPPG_01041 [Spizellomyces punctatus DAOM BR117]